MLKIENLVTEYGAVRALDGVSFTATEGKITTVIGANGAGKSTLLRTISGLERAKSGAISWADESLVGKAPESIVRSGIAHVPEGHAVISQLTVAENIEMGALFRRRKFRSDVKQAIEEVYELFPRLAERNKQLAGSLSGGERQMLAISRALVSRPKLLLLDEPSLGLAPLIVEQIFQTIKSFVKKMDLTVVLVEQNAMGALKIADEGIVLNLGSVVAVDSAEKLLNDPAVRSAYLGF